MKVLYGIQGTGNGHVARARDVVPSLKRHCELDVLISGTQSEVKLPFELDYRYRGLSFIYNRKGGLDYGKTILHNLTPKAYREIIQFPAKKYDLVISDFEPVSAWAARFHKVPSICLGHQASFLSPQTPRPTKKSLLGETVLKHYAPTDKAVGFHFERYDDFIFTPVVREDVRKLNATDEGHYTVYLPAFDEEVLIQYLRQIPEAEWQVFSKFSKQERHVDNVRIHPVDNEAFMKSFAGARGVLTGAGFETPAETLYLGKKLFTVPIKGQYEQYCNAAGLEKLGVPVLWKVKDDFVELLRTWVNEGKPHKVNYPDHLDEVIDWMFEQLV
ncbi:MAG: glycosyltransferase family protein [Bacteroidota bacterium]